MSDWLIDRSIDWLIDWLSKWLSDSLIACLLNLSISHFIPAYHAIPKMNSDLLEERLKGSLIDNYVLTYYSNFVKDNDEVRIETTFEHAITYGLAIRSNASSPRLECFRRYLRNHPQESFEIIAKNLEPLKVQFEAGKKWSH